MNTKPLFRSQPSYWRVRSIALGVLGLTGGISLLAFAGGTVPDPPVPMEGPIQLAVATTRPLVEREPDCRCAVLHARDIESRIEGHVEHWEALSLSRAAPTTTHAVPPRARALHMTSLMEGVVGFPVRQFRLAADVAGAADADDGAGSD